MPSNSFLQTHNISALCQQGYLPTSLKQNQHLPAQLENFFSDLCHQAIEKKFIGAAESSILWLRHIVDSLLPLQEEKIFSLIENSPFLVDLGSGAGLPSIPLSLVFPHKNFFLLDNDSKRIEFCLQIKEKYNIKNIFPLYGNADAPSWQDIFATYPFVKDKNPTVLFRAFRKPLVSLELTLFSFFAESENATALYYRSHPLDFSAQAGERLLQLGYGDFHFYTFNTPPLLEKRGAYVFEKNLLSQKPFPRRFKKIKTDSLAMDFA